MFNLLPENEKQKVYKQYLMRKVIVALVLLLIVVISGSVFLLPSYILVTYRNQDVERQIENIQVQAEKKNRPELTKRLEDINQKIMSVDVHDNTYAYYDLIDKILTLKPQALLINSIVIQNIAGKGSEETLHIQLTGIALTRNALVTFTNRLKEDELYSDVELPVSSLAQETNAEYVINLEIKS